jgi:hypothetical protein
MLESISYPSISEIQEADVGHLAFWAAFLPSATTDVQRELIALIERRMVLDDRLEPPNAEVETPFVRHSIEGVRAILQLQRR